MENRGDWEHWEQHLSSSLLSPPGSQGFSVPYIRSWRPLLYILTWQECGSTPEPPNYWPLLMISPLLSFPFFSSSLLRSVLLIFDPPYPTLLPFFMHFPLFPRENLWFLYECPLVVLVFHRSLPVSSPPLIFNLSLRGLFSRLPTDWLILSLHFTLNDSLFSPNHLHHSHSENHFHAYKQRWERVL